MNFFWTADGWYKLFFKMLYLCILSECNGCKGTYQIFEIKNGYEWVQFKFDSTFGRNSLKKLRLVRKKSEIYEALWSQLSNENIWPNMKDCWLSWFLLEIWSCAALIFLFCWQGSKNAATFRLYSTWTGLLKIEGQKWF